LLHLLLGNASTSACSFITFPAQHPSTISGLLTVSSDSRETFQEACAARGLLESDNEWHEALEEGAGIRKGSQLRQLFVEIITLNNTSNPQELFERHARSLSDDCRHRLQTSHHIDNLTEQQIVSLALQDIDHLLHQFRKSLAFYNLPAPTVHFEDVNGVP
jgi:hypothetical protein